MVVLGDRLVRGAGGLIPAGAPINLFIFAIYLSHFKPNLQAFAFTSTSTSSTLVTIWTGIPDRFRSAPHRVPDMCSLARRHMGTR